MKNKMERKIKIEIEIGIEDYVTEIKAAIDEFSKWMHISVFEIHADNMMLKIEGVTK